MRQIVFLQVLFAAIYLTHATPARLSDDKPGTTHLQHITSLLHSSDSLLQLGDVKAGKALIDSADAIFLKHVIHNHLLQFYYYAQHGRYYSFIAEYEKALYNYRLAVNHAANLPGIPPAELARLYSEIGVIYFNLEKYTDAIRYFHLALSSQSYADPGNSIETIQYKAYLINAYWNDLQFDKAEEMTQACTIFLQEYTDPYNKNLLNIYLAVAEYYLTIDQQYAVVDNYLSRATRILQAEYPVNHFNYGILYFLKGLYNYSRYDSENALYFFQSSQHLLSSFPALKRYQIESLRYIAATYCFFQRNYQKAISLCNQSISKGYSPAYFYYLIGLSHSYSGEDKLAKPFYYKAISSSSQLKKTDQSSIISQAYIRLSRYYSTEDQTNLKINCLKKALDAARTISTRSKRIHNIYREISQVYYQIGDYSRSLKYAQLALIAASYSFSDTSVRANPAITDFQPFYTLIQTLSLKSSTLIRVYPDNLAYLKTALETQELAVQLTEQRVSHVDQEKAELKIVDDWRKNVNNAVYYSAELYKKTGQRQYAEKALYYAEKGKMQVLLINTERKNKLVQAGVPDSLIRMEDNLKNRILNLENQIALAKKNGHQHINAQIIAELTRLYDQHEVLNLRILEEYPAFGQLRYDVEVKKLSEIQNMLFDDQAILEYQLLMNELISFVITRDSFYLSQHSFDNTRFYTHIQQLRNILSICNESSYSDSVFNAFLHSSQYLYSYLIKPYYDKIKDKRLIIIPHNELTQIPFEILLSEAPVNLTHPDYRSLPYMIREFPIAYAYSAYFMLDGNAIKKRGTGTAIFLPDYSTYTRNDKPGHFQLLEGATKEALSVKKAAWGKLFQGKYANEKTFRQKASHYRILHIASHSVVDEEQPELSNLVMTASYDSVYDGFLYAYELRQMNLNAQLVVLSGCNTGYGKLRHSEGLVSLARSFFYTGVRTVVFTLWSVADQSGSSIITGFYNGLKRRQALDVAMRQAKLDFIEQADPVRTHPFYWTNYIIVGKPDQIPLRIFPTQLRYILLSLLMVLAGILIYRRIH